MDFLKAFGDFAGKQRLFSSRDRLLLAVSGGLDSVVLCELCALSGMDFVIAHCNFRLRGAESERDEEFVRRLSEKYDKPLMVGAFDTLAYAAQKKVSVQVAARELRYEWFRQLIQASADRRPGGTTVAADPSPVYPDLKVSLSASMDRLSTVSPLATDYSLLAPHSSPLTKIVTAHHLDDNIETLLMNFFKGTGIAGLRGILPAQGNLVRPLLFAGKEELRQFATDRGLEWVEDSSNESDKYTRNYFRHQVIPLVERVYPGALHNLADNLDRFRGVEWFYREAIARYKSKLLETRGQEVYIPVLKLKKLLNGSQAPPMHAPPEALRSLVYEIIRDFGFLPQQSDELIRLLDSGTGRYIESATHRILKNRNWLILSVHPSASAAYILIESTDKAVHYGDGVLHFERLQGPGVLSGGGAGDSAVPPERSFPVSKDIACLDAAMLRFPLLLRKWKPGDYFYPLGMRKKKKLARFFIDSKLSGADKEKTWVLEMDKKIIWVVGLRIDDRFKVAPSSKDIWKISRSREADMK
ncbi:MAG: tRNA lysidine(34) synthetase TilS [Puia sp.]|nr:tRNA lysidine(34) synthetase TilS [Puia sp.]